MTLRTALSRSTALWWTVLLLSSGSAGALPPDFAQSTFVSGLRDPATMAFAPDGRLFIGERITGTLRIATASGQLLTTPFLSLDVPPVRHRSGGLRGFAFDPNFPAEPYVYVFYTKQFANEVRHNRVSRFTVSTDDPNLADPASEVVLMELPFNSSTLGSSGSHNGGAVVFGGDGLLYFTTGDGWNASAGYGAGDPVQSLSTYTGKLFRIGKDGTIPTDNPFHATASGNFRAIYALGFRNPYAATVHPVSGEVFVCDVGTAHGGNKDYLYRVFAGANFQHEGYGGIGTAAGTWARVGTSIISGAVWYDAEEFPATYHDRLFVTSWRRGFKTVRSLTDTTVEDFASADMNDQGPLYPCVGPDGAIYLLDSTYETSNGQVHRIAYTALNRAEPVVFTPNGGVHTDSVAIELSSATPGATLHYTLDGSTPDEGSPQFIPPSLTLHASATVTARAFADGFDPSVVTSAVFEVQPSASPQFQNQPPSTVVLGTVYQHAPQTTGNPAPHFSLDAAPTGMSVHPETGTLFWVADTVGNATVTLRASNGIAPDATQTVVVIVVGPKPSDWIDPANRTEGGLRYSYFEDGSQAIAEGIVAVPGVEPRLRDDHFQLHFRGYVQIPAAGSYQFTPLTASGDEVELRLGEVPANQGPIELAAGWHRLELDYAETTGPEDLELRWSGPGLPEQVVPSSAFAYDRTAFGHFSSQPAPALLNTFPVDEEGTLPSLLSQTGAFIDTASLTPSRALIPYTPNSKLWSDAADKLRWIVVPHGQRIGFQETGSWEFPPGTVLVKHFEIGEERRRIETRFEILKPGGSSYLVTYRWRPDQSDADLVGDAGDSGAVVFDGRSQTWFFPSRAECVACHNSSVDHVLGVSTRQLNGTIRYDSGVTDHQLRTWTHLGLLDSSPSESAYALLDGLTDLEAPGADLEQRLRSYLDSNCAFCHNRNAAPEGTQFVLEYEVPLEATGIVNGPSSQDLGLGNTARVIAARDPRNSVLYHRLAGTDPSSRMPPIGRTLTDPIAREALIDWILSLPPSNTEIDVPDHSRRWTFDGTTGDGQWRDTANAPSYATGQIGQALAFDGNDDAVDLGPLDAADGSGLTITLWFRADDFGTSDARFLSKADGDQDQDHYWMISTLNGASDGARLRLRLKAGGSTTTLITSGKILSTGVWTHVAARYDGATMKLYKDGIEVASVTKTGVLDTNGTVDAAIGNQPTTASGGSRPFDGWIDDVRIYPRALSEAEILTVKDAGGAPNAAPTLTFDPPSSAVGPGHFLTRADAATDLASSASDAEDGPLTDQVTWFSAQGGDVSPESLNDGPHTLIATVRDSSGSADSKALRLHIVPGFEGWASDLGWSPLPTLDPNSDGLGLLHDYAFGLDPSGQADSPVEVRHDASFDRLRLTFPVLPHAIDLRYRVQFGEDPAALTDHGVWTPHGDGVAMPGGTQEAVNGEAVEADAFSPSAPSKRQFGRLLIEQP